MNYVYALAMATIIFICVLNGLYASAAFVFSFATLRLLGLIAEQMDQTK